MAFVELLTFAMATCSEEKIHLIIPEKAEGDIPVLYLLHGGSGNCDDWLLNSSIERYAEKKGIAVVMPSAGPADRRKGQWSVFTQCGLFQSRRNADWPRHHTHEYVGKLAVYQAAGSFSFESGFSQTDLDSFPCTYQRLFAGNGNGVL